MLKLANEPAMTKFIFLHTGKAGILRVLSKRMYLQYTRQTSAH